jgi:ribonuclease HII
MNVGIDEVGRGPWAGPLVFGAVVLGEAEIDGLTDSKKLTKKRREALSIEIHEKAIAVGLGWVDAGELDEVGMSAALVLACRRALEQITVPYQQIILDGTINFLKDTGKGPFVTTMAKADLLVPSVSAASIVAKVARDRFMATQDEAYPGYGFASHSGYGTAAHRDAIERLGVTPLHRLSFAPLAKYAGATVPSEPVVKAVTSGEIGETAAARYLTAHGYRVLERNWRIKAGEVDIIAEKDNVIHFVEVKYRKNDDQGGGMAAITPTKLKHMERAARLWMQRNGDVDSRLSVVEVTGPRYEITQFLEQV